MKWTIPGTVLEANREDAQAVEALFSPMFLAGGIVLSQVANLTGLEPHTVQYWIKRGCLPPPQRKRYTLRQLCRIVNINMLKSALPMEKICSMLGYINGQLDDESDDTIDDSVLYFAFVRVAAKASGNLMDSPQARDQLIADSLADYQEPVPGAKARVEQVIRIMLIAWSSAQLRREAEVLLDELEI